MYQQNLNVYSDKEICLPKDNALRKRKIFVKIKENVSKLLRTISLLIFLL